MQKVNPWLKESKSTITNTKYFLSNFSIVVRNDQYQRFEKLLKPGTKDKVLDIGVSSDESFKDVNMFEKLYPYTKNIVGATIEEPKKIKKLFPEMKVVKITAGKKLPFKDKQFDIVTAWATLEHVGGYKDQEFFLKELSRVGKKMFLTTPYRGCIYEPHSGVFFLHWLPLKLFRQLCIFLGKPFWSKESHLNPLFVRDVYKISPRKNLKVDVYNMFGLIPSHLLIYATK